VSVPRAKRPFKRSLLGYRPSEVEDAIAARDSALDQVRERLSATEACLRQREVEIAGQAGELEAQRLRIRDLEQVATRVCERVVERERELAEVRSELARIREENDAEVRSLARLAEELEQVRRQARGQATRMRLRALRDAAELSDRVAELARRPAGVRERLIDSLQAAIERIAGEAENPEQAVASESNGYAPGRDAGEVFEGMIEVDVGPLSDFSQLVGFEDAADGIAATSEISVTAFAQGRATLEMRLDEPVELLRELEERSPFEFRVRDTRSDRVVLDVDEERREAA
jgi:hypothetical protein